jgi:hypothetical protein
VVALQTGSVSGGRHCRPSKRRESNSRFLLGPDLPKERRSTKTAESSNRIQRPQRKIHFGSFLLGRLCSLVARPQLDL